MGCWPSGSGLRIACGIAVGWLCIARGVVCFLVKDFCTCHLAAQLSHSSMCLIERFLAGACGLCSDIHTSPCAQCREHDRYVPLSMLHLTLSAVQFSPSMLRKSHEWDKECSCHSGPLLLQPLHPSFHRKPQFRVHLPELQSHLRITPLRIQFALG